MQTGQVSDMTFDIDNRIKYDKCQPGDKRGKLICEIPSPTNTSRLTKTVKWDGEQRTETDAIMEMNKFLTSMTN